MNTFFFIAVLVLAVIGAAILLWPQRVKSDFDGGYSHDNSDVRITRVRSPYIIAKDV